MARRGIALALALACSPFEREDPHPRIIDQSGAEFFWVCTQQSCEVHRIAGVSPPLPECLPREEAEYGVSVARFFAIAATCVEEGYFPFIIEERFVVCDDDADCPQIEQEEFGALYECRAGFCQNIDTETYPLGLPDARDLERLCTGHVLRGGDDRPSSELEAAIAVACPVDDYRTPCESIPSACPDPR
jgi:hypothetical protein